jgi:hypothetical protein
MLVLGSESRANKFADEYQNPFLGLSKVAGLCQCASMLLTVRKLAMIVAVVAVAGFAASTATAHATTINCVHTGPVVGHPGMEYICYVHHDDKSMETFFAPGPHP